MIERPTAVWRERLEADAAAIAVGALAVEDAFAARPYPEEMIRHTDRAPDGFDADVAGLVNHRWEPAADTEIFGVIERTVKALNAVNVQYDEAAYETDERELLYAYIENALDGAGRRT